MRTLEDLIKAVQREAQRAEFPVDEPVYRRAGRDPTEPILFAGSFAAPVCIFARDLGKDEVAAGEPLIGAGGRLVRAGLYEAWNGSAAPKSDRRLESALEHALLANTVPYKPPGNKAYSGAVKERFRPFVAELLAGHWSGNRVITLGTEAFQWFAPYANDLEAFDAFWRREDRFEADFPCTLTCKGDGGLIQKPLRLSPLPHPSPLNQRWYSLFPDLLARRLAKFR